MYPIDTNNRERASYYQCLHPLITVRQLDQGASILYNPFPPTKDSLKFWHLIFIMFCLYAMLFIDITFEDSWSDSCSNKTTVQFKSKWQQVQSTLHFNSIFWVVYYIFMFSITRLWSFNDHRVHGHLSNKNHGLNLIGALKISVSKLNSNFPDYICKRIQCYKDIGR